MGRDTTYAADVNLLAVPAHCSKENADVTGEAAFVSVNEHAKVGVGPFDMAPRQFFDHDLGPYGVEQRFGQRPGLVAVQDVDLDAQNISLARNAYPFYAWRSRQVTR